MPEGIIDNDLAALVAELGAVRTATPVENPNYEAIEKRYREASDLQEQAIGKAIDLADKDYLDFCKGLRAAIKALQAAEKQIEKVAEALELGAKVIDIAGKIVAKLV